MSVEKPLEPPTGPLLRPAVVPVGRGGGGKRQCHPPQSLDAAQAPPCAFGEPAGGSNLDAWASSPNARPAGHPAELSGLHFPCSRPESRGSRSSGPILLSRETTVTGTLESGMSSSELLTSDRSVCPVG